MSEDNGFGGVAFTDLYTPEGQKVGITARAATTTEAIEMLIAGITHAASRNLYAKGHGPTGGPAPQRPTKPELHQAPPPDVPPWEDEFPFDDTIPQEVIEAEREVIMGKDWGLCNFPPKASELGFGDRFEVKASSYKVSDGSIKFFAPGGQYPILTHNLKNDYTRKQFEEIFPKWTPKEDGEAHDLAYEIILEVQCTGPDKQTKQGNPYKNLSGARQA